MALKPTKRANPPCWRGFRWALAIEDMVAEGDKVAWRFTFTGTYTGRVQGHSRHGKQVQAHGCPIGARSALAARSWAGIDQAIEQSNSLSGNVTAHAHAAPVP